VRRLASAALALAVLALLALFVLAALLPRLLAGDSVRTRIEAAVEAAVGRELRYERIDLAWLPPSLVLVAPVVAGATPEAAPTLEARSVSLRPSLLSLLSRTWLVDRLVVDGATLRLRRGAAGLELPRPAARAGAPSEAAAPAAPLGLRGLELRDARLLLEDVAIAPPVTWELRDVQARLRGRAPEAPVRVEASFALASGGRARVEGEASAAGDLDLELELEDVVLDPVAPYLDESARVAGTVSGTLELAGPAPRPSRLSAHLVLRDGDVRLDQVSLRGPLRLEAELSRGSASPEGRFDVDATDAELVVGGAFRKPPGTSATVRGRLVGRPGGGLGVDDVVLRVRDLDAGAALREDGRTRLALRSGRYEVAGWEALVPALAGWRLGGNMTLEGVELVSTPIELSGRIGLDGVRAARVRGGDLLLNGALVGAGGGLRSEALALEAAGQPFRLAAELAGLDALPVRLALRFEGGADDVDTLISAFANRSGLVHGRLATRGDLHWRLAAGEGGWTEPGGRVRVELLDGRTSGRTLLEASVDALSGTVGSIGRLLGAGDTQKRQRFESIRGTFELGGGIARTQDLRIDRHGHRVDLVGTLRLSDLSLDMRGYLSFRGADADAGNMGRIRLARVRGTLGAPEVELTPEAARGLAAHLSPGRLAEALDQVVDSEAARGLVEGLGGLLRRDEPQRR
jgi:hypothetical protein